MSRQVVFTRRACDRQFVPKTRGLGYYQYFSLALIIIKTSPIGFRRAMPAPVRGPSFARGDGGPGVLPGPQASPLNAPRSTKRSEPNRAGAFQAGGHGSNVTIQCRTTTGEPEVDLGLFDYFAIQDVVKIVVHYSVQCPGARHNWHKQDSTLLASLNAHYCQIQYSPRLLFTQHNGYQLDNSH